MNVGRAFTYITSDPRWLTKFLIAVAVVVGQFIVQAVFGVGFSLLGIQFVGSIIGLVVGAFLIGYMLEVTRRVYEGVDTPLPEWSSAGDYYVHGWMVALGLLIWFLPFIVLIALISIASVAGSDVVSTVFLLGFCLLIPILVAFWIFVFPLVFARYAVTRQFASMFEVGEIFREIQRAPAALLLNFVVMIATAIIAAAGVIACFIGVFATMPYAYLVQAHMFGQVYRQARGLATPATPAF